MKVYTLRTSYHFVEGYCPIEATFKVFKLDENLFLFEDKEDLVEYYLDESIENIVSNLDFYDYSTFDILEEEVNTVSPLTEKILNQIERDYGIDSLTELARQFV